MASGRHRELRSRFWRHNGVARRLLLALILFSSVVTALLTAVELYADYRGELHGIDERVESIRQTIMPALTESVWVGDGSTIQAQLNGICNLPDITFAEIKSSDGEHWSSGRESAQHRREVLLPIVRAHRGQQEHIGELHIVSSIDSIIDSLLARLVRILMLNAVKTFLVTVFMLAAFQWMVGRHLEDIAAHLRGRVPSFANSAHLRLHRPKDGLWRPDALDHVALAINQLHDVVTRSHEDVMDMNKSLEARVEERTRQLEQARDAALAADRAKTGFLSNISHEIRTPLNGLLGAIGLARHSSTSSQDVAGYLGIAASCGETVLALVNDVLDYSKIRAGKLVPRDEPVEINTLAASVLDMHAAIATAKGLELTLDADPALAAPRRGDSLRLRQVLLNLVGNAVKFTAMGSVRVRTHLEDSSNDAPPRVRIEVRDTGVGIGAEDRQRIFEPFEQVESAQHPRQGGTGLGLSIAAGLIDAMQGRLELESEAGRGALFYFELPWARAKPDVVDVAPLMIGPKSMAGCVLLVEDNDVNRLLAARMLRLLGLDVLEAADGEAALAMLDDPSRPPIALVLMDCQMARLDGLEATRLWRAREAARRSDRLPIIALTANVQRDDIDRCIEAGMDGHLGKPFSIDDLRRVLGRALVGSA
jgi:signal transduction histidine kinase/CheY-like chemotaxis protein